MNKFQHGGNIYNASGATENFLDFSANINPLGLSEKILRTLQENLRGVVNYPDANATELKNAISRRYNLPAKNLILLNGAAEFFYLYFQVLRPRKVLIPVPSFSEYERAARAAGCEVEYFFLREEDNFQLEITVHYPLSTVHYFDFRSSKQPYRQFNFNRRSEKNC